MAKRAIRRHHRNRVINKYKNIYTHVWDSTGQPDNVIDDWAVRTAGRGSISCGCVCCGNPRRHKYDGRNGLTIQEYKALEDAENQIKDIQYNENDEGNY